MVLKMRKLIVALLVIVSLFLISCSGGGKENTGYDGKVFDISANQDNSITATVKKTGINFELILSGKGETISYEKKELVPWNAISKKIINVKIEEGIENIGDFYFFSTVLSEFYLPSSVQNVEKNSFNSLASVYSYSKDEITYLGENKVYYYSETKPDTYGKYWHLVGETPIVWDQYKVLFIGNSFTFFPSDLFSVENPGVAAIFKELGNDLGIELEVDFVVKGAHTLKKFANANDEMGKIVDEKLKANDDYDYILLQEHSTTPANDYNSFNNGVVSLLTKIENTQKNCQVILYATWGFPSGVNEGSIFSSVEAMELKIREGYEKCALENNLEISPVGEAFSYIYVNNKDINLYWTDDKHQGYTGAYLSACVHLSKIFGADVRNSQFYGELSEDVAKKLQEAAYKIVLETKK